MGKPDALRAGDARACAICTRSASKPVGDLIIKHDTWMHLADIVEHWAGLRHRHLQPLAGVAVGSQPGQSRVAAAGHARCVTGSCAAFERGRQLGVTVRSRHIPRCMLPGYEDHVADLREDKVLVDHAARDVRAVGIEDLAQQPTPRNAPAAGTSTASASGVRRDYLERYGDAELQPRVRCGGRREPAPTAA